MVPRLLAPPFTASHASILASLAIVAGVALNKHLAKIVEAFMEAIEKENDEGVAAEIRKSLSALSLSLEEDGIDLLVPQVLDSLHEGSVSVRRTWYPTNTHVYGCSRVEQSSVSVHVSTHKTARQHSPD